MCVSVCIGIHPKVTDLETSLERASIPMASKKGCNTVQNIFSTEAWHGFFHLENCILRVYIESNKFYNVSTNQERYWQNSSTKMISSSRKT